MQRLTEDTFTIHSSGLQAQHLFNITHFVLLHQTVSLYIDVAEYQPISLYNQSDQIFISTRQMTKFDLTPIYSDIWLLDSRNAFVKKWTQLTHPQNLHISLLSTKAVVA